MLRSLLDTSHLLFSRVSVSAAAESFLIINDGTRSPRLTEAGRVVGRAAGLASKGRVRALGQEDTRDI